MNSYLLGYATYTCKTDAMYFPSNQNPCELCPAATGALV